MGSSDNSLESSSFGVKVNTYHNKRENAFIVVFISLYIKHWICPRNVHLSDIKNLVVVMMALRYLVLETTNLKNSPNRISEILK